MKKTHHAEVRMNQRGLSDSIIEIILNNGHQIQAPEGSIKIFFRKKEYSRIMTEIKRYQKLLERAKNGIIVVKDDEILTLYKSQY
jgi:hypothetical protein